MLSFSYLLMLKMLGLYLYTLTIKGIANLCDQIMCLFFTKEVKTQHQQQQQQQQHKQSIIKTYAGAGY